MAASGESEAWVFDKRLQTFADAGLIEQAQHFQFKRTINRWIRVGSHNERQEDGAPSSSDMLERGGIRRQIVNRFRSTERTGRSVGIMIMEGSRDTEDGMARTPTERLLQQQIQTLVPRLSRHRRRAHAQMLAQGYPEDFAKAVVTYLGLAVNKLATYSCNLVRWRGDVLSFERAFDRQALPMVWDYGEINPFSGARGEWDVSGICLVLDHLTRMPPLPGGGRLDPHPQPLPQDGLKGGGFAGRLSTVSVPPNARADPSVS